MSPRKTNFAQITLVLIACFAAVVPLRLLGRGTQRGIHEPVRPKVFTARLTPARLARGRYLVQTVAGCFDCHSEHEYVHGQWLVKPGMEGAGRIYPSGYLPLPPHSEVVAPNITPDRETGIGSWTDAQIDDAVQQGVAKGGRPLFDLMPYWQFAVLSNEDIKSIIVYLRTVPPVHHVLPTTRLPFPVHVVKQPPVVEPLAKDASPEVRRGWYLTRIAGCSDCHTPLLPHGKRPASMVFAGGLPFHGPFGVVVSLNITPSPAGIGSMTESEFSRTLHTGRVDGTGRRLSPVMPYDRFRNLKPADIRAIYAYLRTVPPFPRN